MKEHPQIVQLYQQYHRDVYQFSLFFTNSVPDAEDITQETFIKAMKNIKTLKDPERAKAWLLSIARHTAIDHLRKKKFKWIVPDILENLSTDKREIPDEQILQREKWQEVQDALLKLRPNYRALLILRGFKELSIGETAEILQCTELKVRVDFHRAVKALKKELIGREGAEGFETGRDYHSGS